MGGESWVNPLPAKAAEPQSENQIKIDPLCGSFFDDQPMTGSATQALLARQSMSFVGCIICDYNNA